MPVVAGPAGHGGGTSDPLPLLWVSVTGTEPARGVEGTLLLSLTMFATDGADAWTKIANLENSI